MTTLIIKSKIRQTVKDLDEENIINNVAVEVEDALDNKVKSLLKDAIKRAKANQRKTLHARDL